MSEKIVIVGGGLAGATCGLLLRREGFEVTILERLDAASKSKLCGGLMTPRSIQLAEKIYSAKALEPLFGREFHEMLCVTDSHQVMVNNILLRSLYRKDLDDLALKAFLEAGGTLVDACDVKHVDQANHKVRAVINKTDRCEFGYDLLIAADGALSSVRRSVTETPQSGALCLEAEVKTNPVQPLTMVFDSRLHGYFWYIPRGGVGSSANVGCVAYKPCDEMEELLQEFAAKMGTSYKTRRGAFLPKGNSMLFRHGDVYFLGDAAGLACPTTGEGIYYAMKSADALCKALTSGASYAGLMKGSQREIAKQYKARDKRFYSKNFMDIALAAADHTPYGMERAVKFALKHFASF